VDAKLFLDTAADGPNFIGQFGSPSYSPTAKKYTSDDVHNFIHRSSSITLGNILYFIITNTAIKVFEKRDKCKL